MTVLRPLSAFITATLAGICIDKIDKTAPDRLPDAST